MPKINQEEYELLKSLDDYWKWIARDKNGGLYKFQEKPKKTDSFRWNDRNQTWLGMSGNRFQFIQWEDEEPHNIQELIEEYLYDNQPKLFIDGQEQSFEFIEESEEKEVKDLEWVKAKLKKDHKDGEVAKGQIKDGEKIDGIDLDSYWRGRQTANYIARCYLEDLDEPETLSEDWIQEHSYNVHLLGTPDVTTVAVPRDDLQNILVPKQEEVDRAYKDGYEEGRELGFYKGYREGLADKGGEPEVLSQEKVQIPWFVYKWIEHQKMFDFNIYDLLSLASKGKWATESMNKFINENGELFIKAWLAYPDIEVEEEQKYRVIFPSMDENGKGFNYLAKDTYHNELWVEDSRTDGLAWEERSSFTEDEIRDLDKGDILFEHFAVKVEELEE